MEGVKDKAIEIYNEMQVYDWCQKNGYMPNDKETKNKCNYMLDEIIKLYGDKDYGEVEWWRQVKREIKKI